MPTTPAAAARTPSRSRCKTAKPGTPEFRAALRDALEGEHEVVLTHGIATMSPTDHNGFDERARVMVTIKDGAWVLQH